MDRINHNRPPRFYIDSNSDSSDTDTDAGAANGTRGARSRRAEPQADDVFGALRRARAHTDLSALVQSAPRRSNGLLPGQRAAAQRPVQTAVRQRPQRMSELAAFRAPLLVSDNANVRDFAARVQALHHHPPADDQFIERADALLQDIIDAHRIGLISYDAANKLSDDVQVQVLHRPRGANV
jgi:hypothetical protein